MRTQADRQVLLSCDGFDHFLTHHISSTFSHFVTMASISPPSKVIPSVTVHPRRLGVLEPPPVQLSDYPPLPHLSRRDPFFDCHYTVSTHILSAAYPRAASALWDPPPAIESDDERNKRIKITIAQMSKRKEAQERGEAVGEPRGEVLFSVVNRYTRIKEQTNRPGSALTLVLLHGIGAHKEVSSRRNVIHETIVEEFD